MNVYSLKNYLIENEDKIELLLHSVGFEDVSGEFNDELEFRCAWEEGSNPTGVRINKETLSAQCFSRNIKGDIITLIQEKLQCNFHKSIEIISKITGYIESENDEIELPFDGFFKQVKKIKDNDYYSIDVLEESILDQFITNPSLLFYKDGITEEVQRKYQIGYDVISGRITVPWRSFNGELVGVMGRLNKEEVLKTENKWFPILNYSFSKSKTLFAFSNNYHNMQKKSAIFISESEKSPMILDSKGIDIGVALGGNSLSTLQANNIKSLFLNTIIIGLDEGLDEDHSRHMAEQLKMNSFHKNRVGYIYDKNNLIIPKDSKLAPADLPKEDIARLMKNHTIWI